MRQRSPARGPRYDSKAFMREVASILEPAGIPFALEPLPNGLDRIVFRCGCAIGYEGDQGEELHAITCRFRSCAIAQALPGILREEFPETPIEVRHE